MTGQHLITNSFHVNRFDFVFLFRLEHPGSSSSLGRYRTKLQWTSLLQSIPMVYLSREFHNSLGKFPIGIRRFTTL